MKHLPDPLTLAATQVSTVANYDCECKDHYRRGMKPVVFHP